VVCAKHCKSLSNVFFSFLRKERFLCQTGSLQPGCWWLTPVILPSQEEELRRKDCGSKPAQANSSRDPDSKKKPSQKRTGGVAQGAGLEFKPQY
jgi:hypothetical protein